jgi:hypothetical protein
MSNQVIIYKQDNGCIAVVNPTQEALQKYGIAAIAKKDVPAGKKFKIVNISDLPQDTPQESWDVSELELTDGVGSISSEFDKE